MMAVLLAGAACSPQEQAADPPIARGTTLTLAQTPQTDPPVLIPSGGRLLAFWIGSDERGVHQDARIVHQDALEPVATLPLPPIHPYAQDGLSAPDGSALLFWLDEHPETPERAALYAGHAVCDVSLGDDAAAAQSFQKLLTLQPDYAADPNRTSPKVLEVFELVRARMLEQGALDNAYQPEFQPAVDVGSGEPVPLKVALLVSKVVESTETDVAGPA